MENKESEKNNSGEVDILVLLDYFKKGISNIFKGISNIFKGIGTFFISFLILIKRNLILFAALVIAFGIFGHYKQSVLPSFYYEMIVSPNYDTSFDLYNFIESNKLANSSKFNFNKIAIEPVKSLKDEVDSYYDMAQNSEKERDTVFYKEYKIKEYIEQLKPTDYSKQLITIVSSRSLNPDELQKFIISAIEKNEDVQSSKKIYLESLDESEILYLKGLRRIDSLMSQVSTKELSQTNIQLSNEGKINIEKDLSDEYKFYVTKLNQIKLNRDDFNKVIRVVSPMKRVDPKSTLKINSTQKYALFGFILALSIVLSIRLYKYLNLIDSKK